MIKTTFTLTLLTFVLGYFLGLTALSATESVAEIKEFDNASISELVVQNISGKLVITSRLGSKTLIHYTKNKFSDKCKLAFENKNKKLIVKVESAGFFTKETCDVDFEISVARATDLDITNISGNSKITDISGKLKFTLVSGDLNAVGEFTKTEGVTVSGNVVVNGLTGGGHVKTVSGDLNLSFANSKPKGNLEINSVSGNATLKFFEDSVAIARLATVSGIVTNEVGGNSKDGFEVSMKSVSGDLKVIKAKF